MISLWMGLIISIVLIVLIAAILAIKTKADYGIISSGLLVIFGFIYFLFFGHSLLTESKTNIEYTYENRKNIYSLEDSKGISGNFVLGFGQVDSDLYYYVMFGDDKEGYTVSKYRASDIRLFPENADTPYYIEKYENCDVVEGKNLIFGGLFEPLPSTKKHYLEGMELHLPKDYIKRNYNIDLK